MKKFALVIISTLFCIPLFAQKSSAFKDGEFLRYKMSYSGFLRAGSAILEVKEEEFRGKKVYHTKGTGWTSGMIKWFFEVDDVYESYFDKETLKPYLFKRKINEGGYKKHRITAFNYTSNTAYIQDFVEQKDTIVSIKNIQDMLSSFYYLRNKDVSKFKVGDEIKLDMFIDAQTYPFRLRFLGKEELRTRFGKVNTLMFRPLVQSGRVFKEEESVTIWITDDANKIPIRMKASLAVGSLRADLEAYKGLVNSFMNK
ncbi:DUF3108 domain-containing protein [Polaribacter marinivivus]|uniref:DUF3108 domain-containing protein n=1 Tax=Polaribacter marinivivus TaxID=1524260 RepID=A0ABV8R719_9FLAO